MNNNPKGAKNPKKPLIFYYAVMLLVLMMLNWLLFPSLLQRQVTEVGYDEFISMVDKGQVETIAYDKQDQEITFEAKNDKGKDALYKTGIFPDDELVGRLLGANVKFAAEIPTQTSPLLSAGKCAMLDEKKWSGSLISGRWPDRPSAPSLILKYCSH